MKATYNETGLYKNGFLVVTETKEDKELCRKYKGVVMNKFFVPSALFNGFKKLAERNRIIVETN